MKVSAGFVAAVAAMGALVGFAGQNSWTYDADAGTLSMGDNVVYVQAYGSRLMLIDANKDNPHAVDLDFSKPIEGGYYIEQSFNDAFKGNAAVTRFIAPPSLTIIGMWTFQDCSNLTEVVINENIQQVAGFAFGGKREKELNVWWKGYPTGKCDENAFNGATPGKVINYIPSDRADEWSAKAGDVQLTMPTADADGEWDRGSKQPVKFGSVTRTYIVADASDNFSDPKPYSLRWMLKNVGDGDIVTFDDSLKGQTITIVGVNTAKADTSLVIDKAITIDGNGVIIDGGWNGVAKSDAGGRIFLVSSGLGKVAFKDITLQNGHGRGWNCAGNQYFDGGAVYALSPVRFENCSLINNASADETAYAPSGTGVRGGGAISAENDVEIVSCLFRTNCIPTGSSSYGGAIRQTVGTLTVTDTVFDHDYSLTFGGGVAYLGAGVVNATFRNCKFIENSSVMQNGVAGGAIYAEMASNAALKFFDCVFRGGSGANQGGAICCRNNVALVAVNCEFADSYTSFGGAIYANTTKPLLFLNCTFLGNAAVTWGGAMEITDRALCLVNCTIAGSYCAGNNGGGLYAGKGLHLLNSVLAYNYWGSSMESNDGNQGANTSLRSLYKGASTAPFGTSYTLATSLEDVATATKLFANYQMVSDMHGAGAAGARVSLPKAVVMPTFAEDPKSVYSSRVIAIEKDSVLNGTGYPVRANADYSYVEYSEDEGATWKQFFKLEDGVDTVNMTPVTADQRGVAYYKGKTPIGAATYAEDGPAGFSIIIR